MSVSVATWYGFNAPFLGGPEKVLSRQTDERLIRNDLLQLLLTSPGERVMRPDFGSPIRKFVFENMTAADLTKLENDILETIRNNEPRVVPTSIKTEAQDNNILNIKVYGFFNLDVNNTINSNAKNASMLIELNLPTNKIGKVENSGVAK